MSGPDNQFEKLAEEAAARILASSEMARQLTLLPGDDEGAGEGAGRGKGKRSKGLGAWLKAAGYQDPGERLASLANLDTLLDPVTAAIARAEQAAAGLGITKAEHKLGLFQTMFAHQIRALEALMPYLHAKAAPDTPPPPAVQIFMQQNGQAMPGDGARVVNPAPAGPQSGVKFAPPPMPGETKQNQGDSE